MREEIRQQAEEYRQPYKDGGYHLSSKDIREAFEEGAEWMQKKMINKACKILENVTVTYNRRFFGKCEENAFDSDFIKEFRQVMEE